jgi:sodium/pantothenate symporter
VSAEIFKYLLTFLFIGVTFYLANIGMKKTKSLKGFSIGNNDMGPILIGITMAASISSTATFVINPGFVYNHGLSAYIHYGLAASFGIITAFLLLTRGFRKLGASQGSLTIPDWIFHRYGSRGLALFFALINLLSITFVVLILVGCSILMSSLFPMSQKMALIVTLLFVFSYVLMGGTYAHAYTNSFQGVMMVLISAFLFVHGLKYFEGGFINSLQSISLNYASVYNTESVLYYDFFSVFLSAFLITFALMFQPHILTKVLYLRDERDVNKFIGTTFIVGMIFGLMLFVGFYARLKGLDIPRQDAVVTTYIFNEFSGSLWGPYVLVFVSLTLLAAGMSTLDGILVSLSAMVVNDLYMPLARMRTKTAAEEDALRAKGLMLSRWVLIGVGLFAFALAWNPPAFVGLFAQKGVYGLAAASLVPILFGVLLEKRLPVFVVATAACIGLFGHLWLNLFGGYENPSVSSGISIIASVVFTLLAWFILWLKDPNYAKTKLA